ncbi:unnamed protein product [Paramecium pentaurelia]|uniref:rRNA biogenesis protein RRP36 n=1 Tax=Paramecium pentaurelia TaxID=43138 RepID=A0A8S1T3G7_9CILI|nr:unnamed protein product [Paramecium pentaurelia]
MDEELQIKQQLSQVPFHTLLGFEKEMKSQQQSKTQIKDQELPKKIKGGPEVRDARKPLPKIYNKPQKKQEQRDPRFDQTSGELSLTKFYKSYNFIGKMKTNEIQVLKKQSEKLDQESKQKIKQIIGKQKDEIIKQEQYLKKQQAVSKLKKKNYHPKQSVIKQELLKQKFDQLEATGKLDAYMKQKKKSISKKLDFASKKIKK